MESPYNDQTDKKSCNQRHHTLLLDNLKAFMYNLFPGGIIVFL